MFKSYQYATNHIKISIRLGNMRLKEIQVGLLGTKSMGKGSKCVNILVLKMGCCIKN